MKTHSKDFQNLEKCYENPNLDAFLLFDQVQKVIVFYYSSLIDPNI